MVLKNNKSNKASCIAVFGTGSDVGKSIITTALCRYFANHGICVAPYKAQNMSNNSGITPEGLEMGRAQIVQAEAAKITPHVDMNPILLKPTSDTGAQVVLLGTAVEDSTAMEYHKKKETYFFKASAALDRMRRKYDLIIIEGAGSCAEVNLLPNDIVNFKIAEYADANVILAADIHKGGVFAQIIGTLECLPQNKRDRIKGFIINRFRGDINLFSEGSAWIEKKTGKKVFGILPWYDHIRIEAEDSVVIENLKKVSTESSLTPAIAVLRFPHISNFTDFDPLLSLTGVQLSFIEQLQDISTFKAVILPGSKNTRFDLNWLHKKGWSKKLSEYANQGGSILGLCGGYQMMGRHVHDPDGVEGKPGTTDGLSFLPVTTILKSPKTTTLSKFYLNDIQGTGYEIHMGETIRDGGKPMFQIFEQNGTSCNKEDGCIANGSRCIGTYMHGMFDSPGVTKKWLQTIGLGEIKVSMGQGLAARDREYDLLAAHFEKYVDLNLIKKMI